MNYWQLNLPVLEQNFPGLGEKLLSSAEDGEELDLRVSESAARVPTLSARGVLVHSGRDPEKEAQRLVQAAAAAGDEGAVLILGFGLGYAAEAAAETCPGRLIIVIERRPAVLRKALESRDLRTLLSSPALIFSVGEDSGVITGLLSLSEGKPSAVINRTLYTLDEAWYAEAAGIIRTWGEKDEINSATLRRFGKRWVKNLGQNMTAIRDFPGVSLLRGACRDFPLLLAAAGPSLDHIRQYIPELAKRCVLLACDTSLRVFLSMGIQPDFTVSVDPQFWNARHLDRCTAPDTVLIAESAVYPGVLRHNFRSVFLCSSLFPLGRFIEDRLDPKGVLGAGGSVATTAWDFARLLDPSSLWIAALDLSYPGLKTHFKGAVFEERVLASSCRLSPAETGSAGALRNGQPFYASSSGGSPVLTDKRLSLYAFWFEKMLRLCPGGAENFRLHSSDVLNINGMKSGSMEELLSLPDIRGEISRRFSSIF